ncbi:MAG: hypothetical protein NDJ90_02510 [Oligoflexia bacterium]|nr:hypothetical protein [Oligoflexia bacterium]
MFDNPQAEDFGKAVRIFGVSGLVWGVFAALILGLLGAPAGNAWVWLAVIWGISLADLLSTGKLVILVLAIASGSKKNQEGLLQAFAWGSLKLACFGLLGVLLIIGKNIPTPSILLGLATLFVVPVGGGLWWYRKVLRHA